MTATAQSYRSTVNEGNEYYREEEYDRARELYEQAAATEAERPESHFNIGNAAYRTEDIQKALEAYEKAGMRVRDKATLARTLYNAGNTFLKAADEGKEHPALQQAAGAQGADLREQAYRQAIEWYKKALKLDPTDEDARYNLTYARKKLDELQQQQQNQDQNKDQQQKQKDQDKEQDQQNQDKNRDEEQQKKDQQDQQQQQQQNQKDQDQEQKAKPEQQQSKPKEEPQMSKQQAEQILRALERQEKELQKKKRQQVGVRTSVEKDW
ncbi:MAG: tetratricopeptide repeat protein [Bacteroidetes bacterium]|nr:tetratricopeptide repeat protein [Bacteroidota bacterium]